jgi:hypothetical protein
LKDVRDVLDELDDPGVDAGVDGRSSGGVTDAARCIVAMWMDGRASQKDVVAAEGAFMANGLALGTGASSTASIRFTGSVARFLSRAFLFSCSISSLSVRSIGTWGGHTSKSPARTVVAVRRACLKVLIQMDKSGPREGQRRSRTLYMRSYKLLSFHLTASGNCF